MTTSAGTEPRESGPPSTGIGVIIPALAPAPVLVEFAEQLRAFGFAPIIVINDGSDASYTPAFDRLAQIPGCEVLYHAVNLGKGRALKTGLNHLLVRYPETLGVVTFDADGQHTPEDARRVADALRLNPNKLVLGSRTFKQGVPWKSLAGNLVTRQMFAFFAGTKVSDTQTGLRGIPTRSIPGMLRIDGERYEYEMSMLAQARSLSLGIMEEPIQTIYIEGNRASHFNPVLDSMRVAFVMLRFYFSSLVSAGLDLVVFSVMFGLTSSLFWSVLAGRALVGPLVNFALNRSFVFHNRSDWGGPLARYFLLLIVSGSLAYVLILGVSQATGWNVVVCKAIVEMPLSLFNFAMQRTFVFTRTDE